MIGKGPQGGVSKGSGKASRKVQWLATWFKVFIVPILLPALFTSCAAYFLCCIHDKTLTGGANKKAGSREQNRDADSERG